MVLKAVRLLTKPGPAPQLDNAESVREVKCAVRVLVLVLGAVLLIGSVFAAVLLLSQNVECRQGGRVNDEWSIRNPFGDNKIPSNCSNPQSGAARVLELISGN